MSFIISVSYQNQWNGEGGAEAHKNMVHVVQTEGKHYV